MNDFTPPVTDPIFSAFLIPAGPNRMSVCFELNTDHPVFTTPMLDPLEIQRWRTAVMHFPLIIKEIGSKISIQDQSNNSPVQSDPHSFNYDLKTANLLWYRFLGLENLVSDDKPPGRMKIPPYGKPPYTQLLHQKISNLRPVQTVKPNMQPAAPESAAMINGSQILYPPTTDPVISVSDFFKKINAHPMVDSIAYALSEKDMQGIEQAHQAALEGINIHNEAVKSHQNGFASVSQVNEKVNAIVKQLKIDHENRDMVMDFVTKKIKTRYEQEGVKNTPTYIQEAIDKLNSFNNVRHLIGTTIDLTFPKLKLQDESVHIYELNKLIAVYTDYPNYFDEAQPMRTFVLPTDVESVGVLPAGIGGGVPYLGDPTNLIYYRDFYDHGFIKLGKLGSAISYETQSLVRNMASIRASGLSCGNADLDANGITLSAYKKIIPSTIANYADMLFYQAANRLINIGRRANNQLTDIHTKGHQLYITDPKWLAYNPADAEKADDGLHEHNLISGYVVFVKITDPDQPQPLLNWTSITKVDETLKYKKKSAFSGYTELPVHIDHVIQSVDDSAINIKDQSVDAGKLIQGITTGFTFNWDGTIISSRNPMRYYDKENSDETLRYANRVNDFTNSVDLLTIEYGALHKLSKKVFGIDYYPYQEDQSMYADFMVLREYLTKTSSQVAQLKFSSKLQYQYILAAQYLNGYCPVTEEMLQKHETNGFPSKAKDIVSFPAQFLRHEHINEVLVILHHNIYTDDTMKVSRPDHLGESNSDLVVRSGFMTSNDICRRYILPPPVPAFQTYLWYDYDENKFMRSRKILKDPSHNWYLRYQCEHLNNQSFEKKLADCKSDPFKKQSEKLNCRGCNAGCESFCGTSIQPAIFDGGFHYLPDPIVTGFVVEFYSDKECLLPANPKLYPSSFCPFQGGYPELATWQLILGIRYDSVNSNVIVQSDASVLTIHLDIGSQLYAEIIPTYSKDDAHFYPNLLDKELYEKSGSDGWYYNKLYAGTKIISLTHASQKPIFDPVIKSMNLTRFRAGVEGKQHADLSTDIELQFEQLNLWNGMAMPGTQPTGEMDLYAVWDEYTTAKAGVEKSMKQKLNAAKENNGYIYLGKIVFEQSDNNGPNYSSKLIPDPTNGNKNPSQHTTGHIRIDAENSFRVTYFTDAVFRLKNTSKFTRYFTNADYNQLQPKLKEAFSVWSSKLSAPLQNYGPITYQTDAAGEHISAQADYLFNNVKPAPVEVAKVIPLIIKDYDKKRTNQEYRFNRFRIFFSTVPQTGKDGRIGVLIQHDKSVYKTFFEDHRSKAGRDIVTDRSSLRLSLTDDSLTFSQFNVNRLEMEVEYMDRYLPYFDGNDTDQTKIIGLMSYIVQYDIEQCLYYIELELVLKTPENKELHNPFVQLSLVNYQPHSANYGNIDKEKDTIGYFNKDYRISTPVKLDFFSIYPSRKFENPLLLFKHHQTKNTILSGDISSLYFKEGEKRFKTEFVLCVQEHLQEDFWLEVSSDLTYLLHIVGVKNNEAVTPGSHPVNYFHVLLGSTFDQFKDDTDKSFQIEFRLSFHKKLFKKYRVVIHEIENYIEGSLSDRIIKMGSGDFYKTTGIRPKDTFIFKHGDDYDDNI